MRVLDVGCGPGRHSLALGAAGHRAWSASTTRRSSCASPATAAAADGLAASFEELDVRELDVHGEFDAAICLCQGGFGLLGGGDETDVFGADRRDAAPRRSRSRSARSRRRSRCATSRRARPSTRRPACCTRSPRCVIPTATKRPFDLWTTCFTARELELLARRRRARRGRRCTASRPGAYAPTGADARPPRAAPARAPLPSNFRQMEATCSLCVRPRPEARLPRPPVSQRRA